MRQTIIAILLLFTTQLFGQTTDSLTWYLLSATKDSTVKAYLVKDRNSESKYFLKYKNGKKWDTLSFADNYAKMDSCNIEAMQIDGKGQKEIIVKWYYLFWHTSMGHGGFEEGYTQIDIWNLDSRKNIFSAKPDYHFQSLEVNDIIEEDSIVETNEIHKSCLLNYNFDINTKGQITIKNIKVNGDSDCQVDHREGIYIFKDGQYILTKKKNDG